MASHDKVGQVCTEFPQALAHMVQNASTIICRPGLHLHVLMDAFCTICASPCQRLCAHQARLCHGVANVSEPSMYDFTHWHSSSWRSQSSPLWEYLVPLGHFVDFGAQPSGLAVLVDALVHAPLPQHFHASKLTVCPPLSGIMFAKTMHQCSALISSVCSSIMRIFVLPCLHRALYSIALTHALMLE